MSLSKLAQSLRSLVDVVSSTGASNHVDWEQIADEVRKIVRKEEEERQVRQYMDAMRNQKSNLLLGQQDAYNAYRDQLNTYQSPIDPHAYMPEIEDDPNMATKQSNATVLTAIGTLSFANTLFEKRAATQGAEEVFSANLIFSQEDQKTPAYAALKKAIKEAADKFFGEGKYPKNMRWPVRDAGEKEGQYEGYVSGDYFITAKTKSKPGVIGPRKEDVLPEEVWSGQRARFAIRPYGYNKAGNAGVGLALESVQIAKFDCPRMDGRAADPRKVFDDLEGGDSAAEDDEIPF